MQPTDHPSLLPGVEVHAVEDGCVVWVPVTNEVHFLNDTAMRVLQRCDGRLEAAAIQAEFGDPDAIGFNICRGILDQFEGARIIAHEPAGPAERD